MLFTMFYTCWMKSICIPSLPAPFSPFPSSPSFLPSPVRHHVDLVRSPEHPEMEGEYVVEVDGGTYRVWVADGMPKPQVKWEWHLKHLRRIHWHKTVNKLEVEAGRCVSILSILSVASFSSIEGKAQI